MFFYWIQSLPLQLAQFAAYQIFGWNIRVETRDILRIVVTSALHAHERLTLAFRLAISLSYRLTTPRIGKNKRPEMGNNTFELNGMTAWTKQIKILDLGSIDISGLSLSFTTIYFSLTLRIVLMRSGGIFRCRSHRKSMLWGSVTAWAPRWRASPLWKLVSAAICTMVYDWIVLLLSASSIFISLLS